MKNEKKENECKTFILVENFKAVRALR